MKHENVPTAPIQKLRIYFLNKKKHNYVNKNNKTQKRKISMKIMDKTETLQAKINQNLRLF